ncbi:hypothetical protein [Peribacillus frigoritolerans]|uniref:hypothetical protein n=1 Tax=Peribacillus frigoritolerans TaxID=450367 RepID=UPI0021AA6ACB|nr:hypothetical protein [Peribacillus frigoritolerans]
MELSGAMACYGEFLADRMYLQVLLYTFQVKKKAFIIVSFPPKAQDEATDNSLGYYLA